MQRYSKKFMICDDSEGYYDCYIFEEQYDITELKQKLHNFMEESRSETGEATWDLDTINAFIKKNYRVKEVILFDKGNNAEDVMTIAEHTFE